MNTKTSNSTISDTAIEWLVRLQSDNLSSDEEQQFFAWLEESAEHQRAYIEAEWIWEQGNLDQVADDSPKTGNVIPLRKRITPIALAASLALFVIGIVATVFLDYQSNQYATRIGEQLDIVLKDGSHLYLNTNSSIHTDLNDQRRLITLQQGEVFFDVAKDSSRPFLVETENGIIRVLGTQFNVLSSQQGSIVTVLEGSVGVTGNKNVTQVSAQQFIPEARLAPDQQTTMSGPQIGTVRPIDHADKVIAWREGKLIYNGESFEQVLLDINRYFEGEIRVGDETLEDLKVIAVLQLQDKKSTLKALEETFNLASIQTSKELTLLYPKK